MVFIWQIIFATAAIVCFAGFVWAIKKHFVNAGEMPAGMRLVSAASLFAFVLQLVAVARMETVNNLLAAAGVALYATSFALFWWTIAVTRRQRLTLAFSDDAPQHLQIAGPYQFVRHPFYTAYLLFWTAGFVAASEWRLIFPVAVMLAIYFRAARLEEAKFAASSLKENYSKYRAETGMFFPNLLKKR